MGAADPSVLVIDDDEDLSAMQAHVLEHAGYDVRVARDGCEGLDRVAERMPALIFLDLRMPRMNGAEFAREFHRRYGRPCPIVVVSGDDNGRARAAEFDADEFVTKPFDVDDLVDTAARYLRA